jgi:hypothetical protein
MNVSTFDELFEFEDSDKDDKFIKSAFISSRSVLESSSEYEDERFVLSYSEI